MLTVASLSINSVTLSFMFIALNEEMKQVKTSKLRICIKILSKMIIS